MKQCVSLLDNDVSFLKLLIRISSNNSKYSGNFRFINLAQLTLVTENFSIIRSFGSFFILVVCILQHPLTDKKKGG